MTERSHELERWFALAAIVLLAVSVVATGWAGAADTRESGDGLAYEPPVPEDFEFTVPETDGVATVDGREYDSVQRAVEAADAGDTVRVRGQFREHVVIETPNLTLRGAGPARTVIDGNGTGDVLTINATGVTVEDLWVRNGGYDTSDNDAGIWIDGADATVRNTRVTEMTFGIWVDGVTDVRLVNNTIVGRERIEQLTNRGNGIQLWKTENVVVAGNRITDVRDGIYYSWASHVDAHHNTMWDLRYGVHYMYSDDCRLANNTSFNNDAGYALMVSKRLTIVDNVAVNNTGRSGHGLLVKAIDDSEIRGNHLVANDQGIYLYNSVGNTIEGNLVLGNEVGVYAAAGSVEERVSNNSFIRNDRTVHALLGEQVHWNTTRGNYWSAATPSDLDDDGIGETRYRPAGMIQQLTAKTPAARVFTTSPAFDAVRVAESTVPLIESPGIVDARPLTESPHNWSHYYERD
ncbi:MAG: nitrous oxide reductase family maturation protein NosD [Haloarculaceae archaeon]